jgi:hypothetical protein
MKYTLLLLICVLVVGCSTTRKPSSSRVLRETDLILGRERDVRKFEKRLDELGARIEFGQSPDERVATVPLPGKPGYFPPRTLRIVYEITDKGMVVVKAANVTSLGWPFAEQSHRHAACFDTSHEVICGSECRTQRARSRRGSSFDGRKR